MLAHSYKFLSNCFINECARKKNAKIPESQSFTVSELYRKSYVLNKLISYINRYLDSGVIIDNIIINKDENVH